MGSAEVGESGRTVNPFSLSEWVRIPPPQLRLKGCYITAATADILDQPVLSSAINEKYNRECILPKGNREDLNGIKIKNCDVGYYTRGPLECG